MRVVKDTPFEFGYITWQLRPPQPTLVVVVKGTFDIVPDGVCTVARKQVPCTGPVHYDDDIERSLRYDSDFAVLKPRGECFLVGTCYPPGGQPTGVSAVAFRVGSVVRSLAVFGDRFWTRGLLGGSASQPVPFTSMPLCWERCFGGPSYEKNPVGRGLEPVETPQGLLVPLPNIEDPQNLITSPASRPEPAGAFPIAQTWKVRTQKTGTYDARWLQSRWPWFPEDFDWSFFNAAPIEQQIKGYWRGDEEIGLQNLHPRHARVVTHLPGIRARAFVEMREAGGTLNFTEVPLRLDTVTVDADAWQVQCVWRGLFDVPSEKLDEVETLFLVHESLTSTLALSECRAWLDRKRREDAEEDRDFEAEDVPPDPNAAEIDPPSAPDPTEAMLAEIETSLSKQTPASPEEAAMTRALLESIRTELLGPHPPEEPLPKPSQARAALESAGIEVPPELAEIPDEVPEEPSKDDEPPEPPPAMSREEVQARHARGESFVDQDLTGADLSGLDLSGADFSGAILTNANLRGCRLDGARFDRAVLERADLGEASLAGASLVEAVLTHARGERAHLRGAVLDGAEGAHGTWSGACFVGASLKKTEFTEIVAEGADFREACLDEADFTDARIEASNFAGASLVDTWFEGVQAARCNFEGIIATKLRAGERADFTEALFRGARAADSKWSGALANKANFSLAELEGADFSGARLVQANFTACTLKGARFQDASLVGATLIKSDVFEGNFEGADLTHADLRGSSFFGAQFWRAKVDYALLDLADFNRTLLARPQR